MRDGVGEEGKKKKEEMEAEGRRRRRVVLDMHAWCGQSVNKRAR